MRPSVRTAELPHGVCLPYAEQGDRAGIPLILLHGLADSWRAFEPVLQHLPASIHALALTQRGHGDASRPPSGYRSRDMADDLFRFMDALSLGSAVIAGASSGGLVAQRFVIDHPERVLGLVLLGSPLTLRDKPRVRELWDSTLSKLEDPIDPAFVRRFVAGLLANPVSPAFLDAMVQDNLKVPARVWRAVAHGLLEDSFADELGAVQSPTLIIWGDRDSVVTRADQEALAAAIPNARHVVYAGAGHVFYWEVPERTAADLASFAEGLAWSRRLPCEGS